MYKFFFIFSIFSISLHAITIKGIVEDEKNLKPVQNAKICDSKKCIKSDKKGKFSFKTDEKIIHIKAIGYKPYSYNTSGSKKIHFIVPIKVKALYLSFWGAGLKTKTFKNILDIIDKTQINALVIDVKTEYGYTSYKTSAKKANRYGVWHKRGIKNIKKFIKTLKQKDIYLIARIVVFKDELQAINNQDYAIKKAGGKIWRNSDNMAWVDPFEVKAWDYTLDIAEDAAKQGFDEINFDYIRFPAKDDVVFKHLSSQKNRTQAISNFLEYAKKRLRKYGVFISVDTYGNICWSKDDNNIGQTIEVFAKHADYLCPMLYPSGFSYGSFNFKYPPSHPYEVIYRSIKHSLNKISSSKMRPWLQAFRDYRKKRIKYEKEEINAQIKATNDLNTNGWMLWSPSSKYDISSIPK